MLQRVSWSCVPKIPSNSAVDRSCLKILVWNLKEQVNRLVQKPSYKKTRQWQGRMYRSMSITVFRKGGNTLAIEVNGCSNNQKQPRTVAIRHKMHALAISLGEMRSTAHFATTFKIGMSQNEVVCFPFEIVSRNPKKHHLILETHHRET